jgi:hypothetical protein
MSEAMTCDHETPPATLEPRIAGLGGSFPSIFGHTSCIRNSETMQQGSATWEPHIYSTRMSMTCQFPILRYESLQTVTYLSKLRYL